VVIILSGTVFTFVSLRNLHFKQKAEAVSAVASNTPAHIVAGLDSVLKIDPNNVSALIAKSDVLAQQASIKASTEDAVQAVISVERAIALDPNNSSAYRILGYANEVQQNYPEAHAAYEKAIALDPKNVGALVGDARIYDALGDTKSAEAGYAVVLAKHPELFAVRLTLARIEYFVDKTPDVALGNFRTVYTNSKNAHERAEAAYGIGTILLSQNKYETAYQYMSDATTIDSKYASGWLGLGTAQYLRAVASTTLPVNTRANAVISSEETLKKAVSLDQNLSHAYYELAVVMKAMGQKDLALSTLATAGIVVSKDSTLTASERDTLAKQISGLVASLQKAK
jgi:tetratricopeptide (TPR) repeat protein